MREPGTGGVRRASWGTAGPCSRAVRDGVPVGRGEDGAEGGRVEGGTGMARPGPPSAFWVRGWGGLGGSPGHGEAEQCWPARPTMQGPKLKVPLVLGSMPS